MKIIGQQSPFRGHSTSAFGYQNAFPWPPFKHLARLLDQSDFDRAVCVLLDINLGDGSGIELRHRLKADGVSVPVIDMTGNEDAAVREAALASGCVAFLTKPFSAQELMEPLKRAGRHPVSGDML
jgi:FixJ family two-component response regulator